MKKLLLVVCVFSFAVIQPGLVLGQSKQAALEPSIELGVFGAYSFGGDLSKKDLGYGAQVVFRINERLSLDLALSQFQDGVEVVTMDVTAIAGTLRYHQPIGDGRASFYFGAGVSHIQLEGEIDLPGFYVEVEDILGFHGTAGFETRLSDTLRLFGEYRYTVSKSVAEITSPCERVLVKDSFNYGLATAGLRILF